MGIRLVNIPMHRIITPALPTARQRDILKTMLPHHVRTDVVRDLLLTTLHYTASYVKEHEDEFLEKVRKSNVLKQEASNVDKFIALVHKYTDFSELTTPMIHEFIDRIEVHEADKSTGERTQEIDIYLKYVGRLDVPMPELTPEELAEKERNVASVRGIEPTTDAKLRKNVLKMKVSFRSCN